MPVGFRLEAHDDLAAAVLGGIGDELIGDQADRLDLLGRNRSLDASDVDFGLQDAGEIAAQQAQIGQAAKPL